MTRSEFRDITGREIDEFAHQCHAASLAVVQALGPGHRVARGACTGVPGQHSWVVIGDDCYDPEAKVFDPTLWSYTEETPGVWTGRASVKPHTPFGTGSIWAWGQPTAGDGEPILLEVELSPAAEMFLGLLGPLDRRGWASLAHAPVGGWPAAEILGAMYDDARLGVLIPIDIVGMVTDRNPQGLYLP